MNYVQSSVQRLSSSQHRLHQTWYFAPVWSGSSNHQQPPCTWKGVHQVFECTPLAIPTLWQGWPSYSEMSTIVFPRDCTPQIQLFSLMLHDNLSLCSHTSGRGCVFVLPRLQHMVKPVTKQTLSISRRNCPTGKNIVSFHCSHVVEDMTMCVWFLAMYTNLATVV